MKSTFPKTWEIFLNSIFSTFSYKFLKVILQKRKFFHCFYTYIRYIFVTNVTTLNNYVQKKNVFIQQNRLVVFKEELGQVDKILVQWTKYFLGLTNFFVECTKLLIW